MTKRVRGLLDEDDLREIQALARQGRQTTSAWVRDVLRAARLEGTHPRPEVKLGAIRETVALAFPIGEIDEVLAEIESGFLAGRLGG